MSADISGVSGPGPSGVAVEHELPITLTAVGWPIVEGSIWWRVEEGLPTRARVVKVFSGNHVQTVPADEPGEERWAPSWELYQSRHAAVMCALERMKLRVRNAGELVAEHQGELDRLRGLLAQLEAEVK